MKKHPTAIAATLLCAGLLSTAARADGPEFKFSGFGTLAAVHSSERHADFVGNLFQPNGAGATSAWSFGPDSKLAGQMDVRVGDRLSAVVQVVSQHRHDNSWEPDIEWANLKYQATRELALRAGRFALPYFLLSESRMVGYASPWVRPPFEAYNVMPITSSDGVDATYRRAFGGANHTLHAYYGTGTVHSPTTKAKATQAWGLSDTVEVGSLTLRAGYNKLTVDLESTALSALLGGFQTLGAGLALNPAAAYQTASAQALAIPRDYRLNDMTQSVVALGASYDPGNWFVMGEALDYKGFGLISDRKAWYLSGGYRFGSFTPYVSYSTVKGKLGSTAQVSAVGDAATDAAIAALNAGLLTVRQSVSYDQNTTSVGLRWDAMKNVALKAQYDRMRLGAGSNGSLTNVGAGFVKGGKVDLFTVAVDFVF